MRGDVTTAVGRDDQACRPVEFTGIEDLRRESLRMPAVPYRVHQPE